MSSEQFARPSSRVMTSSIENGVERRSNTNFGDDIITHHQIQPVKVDDLYVSKGIHFDL